MFKVFLIVSACLASTGYTQCQQLMAMEVTGVEDPMYWCLLNRPFAVSIWQTRLNDGWLTFSRCQIVNIETNGEKG